MWNPFHDCIEVEMFFDRHPFEYTVILRTVSYLSPHIFEICLAIHSVDCHYAESWRAFICKTLECSRFPGPINSKHCKAFAIVQSKGSFFNCNYRFADYAWVYLPKVLHPYSDLNSITFRYSPLLFLHVLISRLNACARLYLIL